MKRQLAGLLKSRAPRLWHYAKYQQYLHTDAGEPEIRIIAALISPQKATLDVGVHLGFYARHFCRFSREVIGFEANPRSVALASRTLPSKARLENVALSDAAGELVLRVPREGAGGGEAALGTVAPTNTLNDAATEEVRVPCRRLDDFDLPPVGLVKIDVEGHEEAVLRGASGLIARDRPNLMIEVEERHNPGSTRRVVQEMQAAGYGAFYHDGKAFRPLGPDDGARLQAAGGAAYVNNFFFSTAALAG